MGCGFHPSRLETERPVGLGALQVLVPVVASDEWWTSQPAAPLQTNFLPVSPT
jgi:hypothetical protein